MIARVMLLRRLVAVTTGLAFAALPVLAEAAPRGGGGGRAAVNRGGGGGGNMNAARAHAPASINHAGGGNYKGGGYKGGGNRGGNNYSSNKRGGNVNIDNQHNTNINVSGNNRGGYNNGRGGYYNGYHDHDVWDAVGTAAAVTATVALTSAVVGSVVNQPPSNCVQTMYGNTTYMQCGSSWYQPSYVGSQVQYVVVNRPY